MGKLLIIEFAEEKEMVFQQTVEWLSSKFSSTPILIKKSVNGFHINPFTQRTSVYKGNNSTRIFGVSIMYQTLKT